MYVKIQQINATLHRQLVTNLHKYIYGKGKRETGRVLGMIFITNPSYKFFYTVTDNIWNKTFPFWQDTLSNCDPLPLLHLSLEVLHWGDSYDFNASGISKELSPRQRKVKDKVRCTWGYKVWGSSWHQCNTSMWKWQNSLDCFFVFCLVLYCFPWMTGTCVQLNQPLRDQGNTRIKFKLNSATISPK